MCNSLTQLLVLRSSGITLQRCSESVEMLFGDAPGTVALRVRSDLCAEPGALTAR